MAIQLKNYPLQLKIKEISLITFLITESQRVCVHNKPTAFKIEYGVKTATKAAESTSPELPTKLDSVSYFTLLPLVQKKSTELVPLQQKLRSGTTFARFYSALSVDKKAFSDKFERTSKQTSLGGRPAPPFKRRANDKGDFLEKSPTFYGKAKPTASPVTLPVSKAKMKTATKKQSPLTLSINKERNKLLQNKAGTKKNFRTGFRKQKPLPKNPNLFCLISINRTKNNTHATISNLFGESKTKWSISAGQLKLSGSRRKTRLSQRMIYKSCLEKALSFGYKFTVIHCRGSRGSKVRIYRSFGSSLSVLLIKDTTGAAHNGCRPPKVRRV